MHGTENFKFNDILCPGPGTGRRTQSKSMSNEHHNFQITSSGLAVVRMFATPKMEPAGSSGGLLPHLHKLRGFTFYKTVDTTLVSARI
jgi:hypothetical protein